LVGNETLFMAYSGPELGEDHMTVTCVMQETAKEAGLISQAMPMNAIGWNTLQGFVSGTDNPLRTVFKLFPWEWMWNEPFSVHLAETYNAPRWIEPHWKFMMSSKAFLAILWELFPHHPNLLEAHLNQPGVLRGYVRKPFFSREGANITIVQGGKTLQESPGTYASNQWVYQEYSPLPTFDDRHPVIGSWIIGDESHGIGIRESAGLITDNLSQFVPHYFE